MSLFNIASYAKSINNMIICRMFNINSDLRNTDEFLKANIIPKTIRVEEDGRIKESMSLNKINIEKLRNKRLLSEFNNLLKTPACSLSPSLYRFVDIDYFFFNYFIDCITKLSLYIQKRRMVEWRKQNETFPPIGIYHLPTH